MKSKLAGGVLILFLGLVLAACRGQVVGEGNGETLSESDHEPGATIAALQPVALAAGVQLNVVVTTNIVGDLVRNVGGQAIDLSVMIPPGTDPHLFNPTPQDVTAVAEADVVLVNGLSLEEFLTELIENAGGEAVVVAVSEGVETHQLSAETHLDVAHEAEQDHEAHGHEGIDPHVWMTPAHASKLVDNIEATLSALDPANAATYQANAISYEAQLAELDAWVKTQIEAIPAENREMVTDHDSFGYYADRYGLTVIGAVIPAYSTNAEPSAREVAELEDVMRGLGVKAVFISTTANPVLAERIGEDLGIQLVPLYTGSLGEPGSGVETYLELIRYNTEAIVNVLK